jgi:hypothetical protein
MSSLQITLNSVGCHEIVVCDTAYHCGHLNQPVIAMSNAVKKRYHYHACVIATLRKWYPYTDKRMNLANFGGDLTK